MMKKAFYYEGQATFANDLRMSLKMFCWLFLSVAVLHLFCSVIVSVTYLGIFNLKLLFVWLFSKIVSHTGLSFTMNLAESNGNIIETTTRLIHESPLMRENAFLILGEIGNVFFGSGIVYLLIPFLFIGFSKRSKKQSMDHHIRGVRFISVKALNKQIKQNDDVPDLPFGIGVKMPRTVETRGGILVGRPAVGKTITFYHILERLIERIVRVIIYDFKGEFVRRFFNPDAGDLLFNPIDKRTVRWNIFNEIKSVLDIEAIAHSLIPDSPSSTDPFWISAARDVFISILYYLHKNNFRTNKDLWRMLSSDSAVIATALGSTPGCERGLRYVEDPKSKQSLGVFAMLMKHCSCFEYMAGIDGDFCIKDWMKIRSGRLFITNVAEGQDVIKPALTLFLDLLARALLSRTDTQNDKTFFLLDEIATLQQMSSIVKLLNLGRSRGCCTYLGTQNYTQLDRIYSKEIRQSIINCCGNCVVFAVNDTETASDSSKLIGDVENLKADKSLSMGLTDHKGGTSLSYHSKTEPLLLPSEIMNFPELTGVVRFANYPPVITKLKYKEYDIIAEPLLIRDDLILE